MRLSVRLYQYMKNKLLLTNNIQAKLKLYSSLVINDFIF